MAERAVSFFTHTLFCTTVFTRSFIYSQMFCHARNRAFGSIRYFTGQVESKTKRTFSEFIKDNSKVLKIVAKIILAPISLLSVVAIDIINNSNHRNILEKLSPSYVQFIRSHYGFVDEDVNEINLAKCVEFFNNNSAVPITVNGYLVCDAMKGDTTTAEALKIISERLISQHGITMVSLEDIEFGDSIVAEVGFGTIDQLHLIPVEKKPKPPSSPSWPSLHVVMRVSDAPIGRVASVWNVGGMEEEEPGKGGIKSNDFRSVVYGRYHNVLSQLLGGLRLYASHSANRIDMQMVFPECVAEAKRRHDNKPKQSAWSIAKSIANHRIQSLEGEIKQLEQEMRTSAREIDAIETDIRTRRDEIAVLRRKYFSFFY